MSALSVSVHVCVCMYACVETYIIYIMRASLLYLLVSVCARAWYVCV
jgi:hypothetical protein